MYCSCQPSWKTIRFVARCCHFTRREDSGESNADKSDAFE